MINSIGIHFNITFIGAGNVAWHLAPALRDVGHHIVQVYSRTLESAKALATQVGAQAVNKYEDRAVEQEKVDSILRSALMSPASKRTNGWEFIVVDDRELLQKMSTCRELGSKFVADAPMAIVVCASPEKSDVWFEDASIAALIIQLAAQDLDLGSCWVQVYNRMHTETETAGEYIRGLLNIPESLEVLNIVTLGYKNEERKPYDEEKLSYDKLHRNTF